MRVAGHSGGGGKNKKTPKSKPRKKLTVTTPKEKTYKGGGSAPKSVGRGTAQAFERSRARSPFGEASPTLRRELGFSSGDKKMFEGMSPSMLKMVKKFVKEQESQVMTVPKIAKRRGKLKKKKVSIKSGPIRTTTTSSGPVKRTRR